MYRLRETLQVVTLSVGLLLLPQCAFAQGGSVFGRWLVNPKKPDSSIVDIFRCGEEACGRISWVAPDRHGGGRLLDVRNPDAKLRTRPLCGLTMMGGFRQAAGDRWTNGWVYLPDSGETYTAKMDLVSPSELELRGYVLISLFGATATWTRTDAPLAPC